MVKRRYLRCILLLALMIWGTLTIAPPFLLRAARAAPASHIVISEVQVGGVSANDEFVELYNPTDSVVVLNGWKLTKKASTGTEQNLVSSGGFTGIIPAHGFFLIAPQSGYTGSTSPDLRYSQISNFLAANNTVLIYDKTGVLIDKVGWGSSLDFEGNVYLSTPANGNSIERKAQSTSTSTTMGSGGSDEFLGNGFDTDDNSQDFVPRSSLEFRVP